jgi:hypothetical protein
MPGAVGCSPPHVPGCRSAAARAMTRALANSRSARSVSRPCRQPSKNRVAGCEPLGPTGGYLQPLPQLVADRPRDLLQLQCQVPQCARGRPEEPTRAERGQLDRDTLLVAVGRSALGWPGARRGCCDSAGCLGVACLLHDINGVTDADDERHVTRREPPVHRRLVPCHPTPDPAAEGSNLPPSALRRARTDGGFSAFAGLRVVTIRRPLVESISRPLL